MSTSTTIQVGKPYDTFCIYCGANALTNYEGHFCECEKAKLEIELKDQLTKLQCSTPHQSIISKKIEFVKQNPSATGFEVSFIPERKGWW